MTHSTLDRHVPVSTAAGDEGSLRPDAARLESASRLAGRVAHDLNNILTAVVGYGTLLAEQVAADPDALSNAREVLAAGERAAQLTRHLLAFSQRQALAPEPTDVAMLLAELRPRLEAALRPDVVLDMSEAAPSVLVHVDQFRLQEALMALAENAVDAMPHGGRLGIELGVAPREPGRGDEAGTAQVLQIQVSDTGCGFPADAVDRIFEPFFTTKPRGQGTGLGLSMVYGFVKQTGGDVYVRSHPGRGTTFTIELPLLELREA